MWNLFAKTDGDAIVTVIRSWALDDHISVIHVSPNTLDPGFLHSEQLEAVFMELLEKELLTGWSPSIIFGFLGAGFKR